MSADHSTLPEYKQDLEIQGSSISKKDTKMNKLLNKLNKKKKILWISLIMGLCLVYMIIFHHGNGNGTATPMKSDNETGDLEIYNSENFQLTQYMGENFKKDFGYGTGILVSSGMAVGAGYVAKVTCSGNVLSTRFGNIVGVGVCISSVAVFLITGSIASGLTFDRIQI